MTHLKSTSLYIVDQYSKVSKYEIVEYGSKYWGAGVKGRNGCQAHNG